MLMTQIEVDQYGTPVSKLPDCPSCGLDELGLIGERLLCYACGRERFVKTVETRPGASDG